MVHVNQEIDLDHKVRRTCIPIKDNQTTMLISIFASDKKDVRLCDEDGLEKVGQLIIPIPKILMVLNFLREKLF